ncbi:CAP domain-containing protein, partial [Neohortaea acidophila]
SGADFSSAVLNSTNFFRARFLASPVQWDATLAQFAHKHAQGCLWEHSGGPYGENLAEGFATPALAVDAWAAEEKHYQYPDGGFSESTGHFTQLVWKNTTHVGCGAVNCGSGTGGDAAFGWYLVCEYAPAGN